MAETLCAGRGWRWSLDLTPGQETREKAMATHSSTLAWQIPWTEEPGRLQSMGSLGVRQALATSLSLSRSMHCDWWIYILF